MAGWIRGAACCAVFSICVCGIASGGERVWTPPDSLVGTWEGYSRVFGVKGVNTEHDSVHVSITIKADGSVEGTAGGMVFQSCRVASNRGAISRALNIRSEYIIHKGTLEGPVVPGDGETRRDFTLPFTVTNGRLRGGVMIKKGWRYPSPMLPRLSLHKIDAGTGSGR